MGRHAHANHPDGQLVLLVPCVEPEPDLLRCPHQRPSDELVHGDPRPAKYLERNLVVRDVALDRVLAPDHEQSRDPHPLYTIASLLSAFSEAERADDFRVREIEQRGVGSTSILRDRSAHALDLERVQIIPARFGDDERGVVERSARRFATLDLVHEKRDADGPTVGVGSAPAVHPFARRGDGTTGGDLDGEDLHAIDRHRTAFDRAARNRARRKHERDAMRVRVGPMAMMRPGWAPVVGDANEHDAAVAVRQTDHGIHQLIVSQRGVGFGDEFGGELLAAREEPAKFFVGEHAMNLNHERWIATVVRFEPITTTEAPLQTRRYLVIPAPAVIPVYAPPSTATFPFTITYFIPVASSVGFW